jgi:hypothetical protein
MLGCWDPLVLPNKLLAVIENKWAGWWFQALWLQVTWDDYSQYIWKIKNVANRQPVGVVPNSFARKWLLGWSG